MGIAYGNVATVRSQKLAPHRPIRSEGSKSDSRLGHGRKRIRIGHETVRRSVSDHRATLV